TLADGAATVGDVEVADAAHCVAAQPAFDVAARETRMPIGQAVEVAHLRPDLLHGRVDHGTHENLGHPVLLEPYALEATRLLGQRELRRQPLHAAGAVEAMAATGALENVLRVLGRGDGAAVAENDDLLAELERRVGDLVDQSDARVQRLRGGCTDAASDG